jgi:hypothetical protein
MYSEEQLEGIESSMDGEEVVNNIRAVAAS